MRSFLEGRPIVARDSGTVSPETPRPGSALPTLHSSAGNPPAALLAGGRGAAGHAPAKVQAVEVDGVVRSILVTCGCGETIEVHCGY